MTTVTVFSSMNKVVEPESVKPIYFTEDWYIQVQKGKIQQTITKTSGKIFEYRHHDALRWRFKFETQTFIIQVYWECEKGSTRMFLLHVTCDEKEEVLSLE